MQAAGDIMLGWFRNPERIALGKFSKALYRDRPFGALARNDSRLRNGLRGLLDVTDIEACGIDPGCRAETLAPAAFARLAARCRAESVPDSALDSAVP